MLLTSIKTQFAAAAISAGVVAAQSNTARTTPACCRPRAMSARNSSRYLLNSVWVSSATTVLGVIVAVPAAYAFSRFRFPGREAVLRGAASQHVSRRGVPDPAVHHDALLRLVDTEWSLILTYLTFGLPLSIWLLKGFYDNIPPQLEQAARIDGASRFQAFLRVVMPLSSPGIIATAIYSFVQAWNEYIYALTFLNSKEQADPAGGSPALLHGIRDELAGTDGGRVYHERASGGDLPGPAAILRARARRRRGEVLAFTRREFSWRKCGSMTW